MARMSERDDEYRYSVAWIDSLATGASMGRAVLTRGDHASVDELPAKQRTRRWPTRLNPGWRPRRGYPRDCCARPPFASSTRCGFARPRAGTPATRASPSSSTRSTGCSSGTASTGAAGFIQYQFAVPLDAEETVRESLGRLSAARCPSFLTVLKRFGPANPGPLSFPAAGLDPDRRRAGGAAGARPAAGRLGRDGGSGRRADLPVQGQPAAS